MPSLLEEKRKRDKQKQLEAIKAQFDLVQQHIKSGNLRQAKKDLAHFDNHPSAKVNEYAAKLSAVIAEQEVVKQRVGANRIRIALGVAAAMLIIIATGAIIAINNMSATDDLELAWIEMCEDFVAIALYESFDGEIPEVPYYAAITECERQAEITIRFERDKVQQCYTEADNGRLDTRFSTCTRENNVWVNSDAMIDVIVDSINR